MLAGQPLSLTIFIVTTHRKQKWPESSIPTYQTITLYFTLKINLWKNTTFVKGRIYSGNNITKFVQSVRNINWSEVGNCYDPQECYTMFFKKISTVYEPSFILRKYVTSYNNRKLWITDGIKIAIKKKNDLWDKSIRYTSNHLKFQYNSNKKYLQRICRKAEKDYYDNLFQENKNDIVRSWKIIRSIINNKNNSSRNEIFHI